MTIYSTRQARNASFDLMSAAVTLKYYAIQTGRQDILEKADRILAENQDVLTWLTDQVIQERTVEDDGKTDGSGFDSPISVLELRPDTIQILNKLGLDTVGEIATQPRSHLLDGINAACGHFASPFSVLLDIEAALSRKFPSIKLGG